MNTVTIPKVMCMIGLLDAQGSPYFETVGTGDLKVFPNRVEFQNYSILYEHVETGSIHLDRLMFRKNFRLDLLVDETQYVLHFRSNRSDVDSFPSNWVRSENKRWFMNAMLLYVYGCMLTVIVIILCMVMAK